ncbi:MAG: hypothetical protein DRJ09_05210 [Bacteroidetes bacterium]|nr:MAG: hypothetical protein DRJ09_05210 [Bacteroidota bacterium]
MNILVHAHLCGKNNNLMIGNYKDIENVFNGMERHTKYISDMQNSVAVLKKYYSPLQDNFTVFYFGITQYVNEQKIVL